MESIVKVSDFDYENIEEDIDEMFIEKIKLQRELGLNFQIDPVSFENTFKNLYHYYIDRYPYSDLPDIFYLDFIQISTEKLFSRNRFLPCLEELDSKQNKK